MALTRSSLAAQIDHTLLKPEASHAEIEAICQQALDEGFASACLHPFWIGPMAALYPKLRLCTVIGFPLGMNTAAVKMVEAQKAVEAGAHELDIVVNPSQVLAQRWDLIAEELGSLRRVFADVTLKLIIETSRLESAQIIELCGVASAASFDWIKTSTGFVGEGATAEVVRVMKEHCQNGMQVKASGGIRDLRAALAMLDAGATRIGSSAGLAILKEWDALTR